MMKCLEWLSFVFSFFSFFFLCEELYMFLVKVFLVFEDAAYSRSKGLRKDETYYMTAIIIII